MDDWETLLVAAGATAAAGFGGYILYDYAKSRGLFSGSPGKWCIPKAMSGEQVASALGVPFAALKSANPGFTYMAQHSTALLKQGTCFAVPQGGKIPSGSGG